MGANASSPHPTMLAIEWCGRMGECVFADVMGTKEMDDACQDGWIMELSLPGLTTPPSSLSSLKPPPPPTRAPSVPQALAIPPGF